MPPSDPSSTIRPQPATSDLLIDRLRQHVDRLAGLIGPRHIGRPSALEAAATLVEREFSSLGHAVERQSFDALGVSVANLVAECRGEQRPAEVIILGAHYDTTSSTPGADDNASAVAVLIEVARLLQKARFHRTVRFVAFANEEWPHFATDTMGSAVYARRCRQRDEHIVGMLCLEMVGYYTDAPRSQRLPPGIPRALRCAFPRRGDFLAAVANLRSWRLLWPFRRGFKRAADFPLYTIALPERIESIRLSDNSAFWDQGFPALMLTDTSFLRNPHYHLPSDTPDTLNYPSMANVAVGVAGGLSRLARPSVSGR